MEEEVTGGEPPTSQVPGRLREAEIDSLINHTDEGSPDEGDFQAILEDLQEADNHLFHDGHCQCCAECYLS
jgi:hypothetical protein